MTDTYRRSLWAAIAATFTVPFLSALAARADDWPQWRGPNRDGVWRETGILKSFPPGGLKVRWRAPVGPGWSSPVVADGRVYLTDSELAKPKAKERVCCFDQGTGKPLWKHSYDVSYPQWAFTRGQEGYLTSTPIVRGGKLYSIGMVGHLICFDARNGKLLWGRNLAKAYQVPEFSCNASPLIEGNLLILFIGGKPGAGVVALAKDSGAEVWKALPEAVTNSSPIAITAGGKRQLIVWTQSSVTSLDPATGKTYWRERLNTGNASAVATPVVGKNLLLVSGLMLKLDADKPAASVLWPDTKAVSRRILSDTSTALIHGDYVYSARSSGEFVCLEAGTGRQLWTTDRVTARSGGASIHPTLNGDGVFLHTDQGDLIRAKLTQHGYQEISRTVLLRPVAGMKAWPPPAYANRHVFARNDEELVCASLAAEP
jgi:outer membrane protein assembly factor BamB